MDGILVRYGVSLNREQQKMVATGGRFGTEEKKKAIAELQAQIKTVTIPEFLVVDPKELSATEQKIQKALRLVYELNGKDPPLYRKFPTFRSEEKPLTIDITTVGNNGRDCAAAFEYSANKIIFENTDTQNLLVLTLAHELKHAEQCDEERYLLCRRSAEGLRMDNAYAFHQSEFMDEARAYLAGARAYYEIFGNTDEPHFSEVQVYEEVLKKYENSLDPQRLEEEAIKAILNRELLTGRRFKVYKDRYDLRAPIGEQDKGLDHIPEVFHLSQELLVEFQKVPREARSLNGKLLQAQKNGHMDEYIRLLYVGIEENQENLPVSFRYICSKGSLEQVKEMANLKAGDGQYFFKSSLIGASFAAVQKNMSREVSQYLLSLQRDDMPVIDASKIIEVIRQNTSVKDLNQVISNLQDDQGLLPITGKDCSDKNERNFLFSFSRTDISDKNFTEAIQMLPIILKLKGKDGKPLVSEAQLCQYVCAWTRSITDPKDLKNLFQVLADENGNLPFSRGAFDIRNSEFEYQNGQSKLLNCLDLYTEGKKQSSCAKIPLLMGLKDKDGLPVISQENIDRILESSLLKSVVCAYAKPKESQLSKLPQFFKEGTEQKSTRAADQDVCMALKMKAPPQAGD